jgi:hypothetical protein
MPKSIEAVIESLSYESKPSWSVASIDDSSFIRLFSGTTDDEIGSIMSLVCNYNQIEIQPSAIDTLENFLSKNFVLPGGLRFLDDGKQKVVPGCCSGLEDWRDWLEVPRGKGVWAGHDPMPHPEFINGKIRLWQDEKADDIDFIDFEYDELNSLLDKVKSDMEGFVVRLGKWAEFIAPDLRQEITEHFVKNMNI